MSKVKDENHIVIHGWMINELKLKNNELLIYAIIYGFSQTENQRYIGSRQYLADWTNSTKQGVDKCLKSLLNKKLIDKQETYINNIKFVYYWTTKFTGVDNKVGWGGQQSLHNNIEYNIENNKNYNKELFEYDWLNDKEVG